MKDEIRMKEKWLTTMQVFDEYERRFSKARAERIFRCPWKEDVRQQIVEETKEMLGYKESLMPTIHDMQELICVEYDTYKVSELRYQTWEHFYASASLYVPKVEEKVPLVFLCCGHGEHGRLSKGYMKMAHRLASLGMGVCVLDNIGQGDRVAFGHWDVIAPFYCGLTLQGMIVMETIAMIRHMQKDERFDSKRFGACGNSGGGTLTMFLCALAPELAVISSSGYPSEVPYLLQKERKHCACNLLPGVAYGPDMWEIYSAFAPKPLLLEQGKFDHLIPYDLARRNIRKVEHTYLQLDAKEEFEFEITQTRHSWEVVDMNRISSFLAENLLKVKPEDAKEEDFVLIEDIQPLCVEMPNDALTTEEAAQRLMGVDMPEGTTLQDVYPPTYNGKIITADMVIEDIGRGEVMRVWAQMECALKGGE